MKNIRKKSIVIAIISSLCIYLAAAGCSGSHSNSSPAESTASSGIASEESTEEKSVSENKIESYAEESLQDSFGASEAESKANEGSATSEMVDGMRKSFKDAIDSYEAFFNDYVDFMIKYSQSQNTAEMLTGYNTFMKTYVDYMAKLEA